jgi:hypothetical protein
MARSRITLDGLPHSEIPGSKPVCGSPGLIAAYHVLHRRPAPRHPPYALSSLTTTFPLLKRTHVLRLTSRRRCPSTSNSRSSVVKEPGRLSLGCVPSGRHRSNPLDAGDPTAGFPSTIGGADRDRTGDLRLARAALSQLSYSPEVGRKDGVGGPKWI